MAPRTHGAGQGRAPDRIHGDPRHSYSDERSGAVAWIAPFIGQRYHFIIIGISSALVLGGFWIFLIEIFR